MDVKEIENAITKLSTDDLTELTLWLTDYQAKVWDEQINRDLNTGKLDALLKDVDTEIDAGEAKPL